MNTRKLYQVRVANDGPGISGTIAAVALAGLMVTYENDTVPEDQRKLVPATGAEGFMLERDVLTKADWDAYMLGADNRFDNDILTPEPVGNAVSARDWKVIDVEGDDYVDTANLDETVAAKTPLKLVNGKWTPCTAAGDIIGGVLERHITPVDAGNASRFSIRKTTGVYAPAA